MSDLAFPVITPVLMPILFSLFSNPTLKPEIRSQTISILLELIEIMHMVKEENPRVVTLFLEPVLAIWKTGLVDAITQITLQNNHLLPIKTTVLITLTRLDVLFPGKIDILDSFMGVCRDLESLASDFLEIQTSLFKKQGLFHEKPFTLTCLEFLSTILFGSRELGLVHDTVYRILLFLCRLAILDEDSCDSILDQSDFSKQHGVLRESVIDCLEALGKRIGKPALEDGIIKILVEFIRLGQSLKAENSNGEWWKLHEACFFLMERYSIPIQGIEVVLMEDLKSENQILKASVLILSAAEGVLATDVKTQFIRETVLLLSRGVNEQQVVIAASGIRSLMSHYLKVPHLIYHYIPDIIHSTILFLESEDAIQDSLVAALELFSALVTLNPKRYQADLFESMGRMLLKIWTLYYGDVFILELLTEIFDGLVNDSDNSAVFFQNYMFSHLLAALDVNSPAFDLPKAASALDLFRAFIRAVPGTLDIVYIDQVYPRVLLLVGGVDDSGVRQSGLELIKTFVDRDYAGCTKETRLEGLLRVISGVLCDETQESNGVFLGPLITMVIKRGGEGFAAYIPELLTAIIGRLARAKMPAFTQTLVVISFLSQIDIDGENGLAIFLGAWCEVSSDSLGVYKTKLSITAMMGILLTADPRLNAVLVKGSLIIANEKKIQTRSMSKSNPDRFQMIPFPIKAVGLILDEYSLQLEAKIKKGKSDPLVAAVALEIINGDLESGDEDYEDAKDDDEWYQESFADSEDEYKDDPIYSVDLTHTIKAWVKELVEKGRADLEEISLHLSKKHRSMLQTLAL